MREKTDLSAYKTTFRIGVSYPVHITWYFINILFFKNSLVLSSGVKVWLLRMFGAKVGKNVRIKPVVNIKCPWKLSIGNNCWIGEDVWIDNLSEVSLGDNVTLSQGALLLTGSHDHTKVKFDFVSLPIVLEEGVWIGAKATVFGGVTCKSHSILGIGSVAEKNLEPYIIYKGNPSVPVLERNIFAD